LQRAADGGWPKAEFLLSQALLAGWEPFPKNEAMGQKWLERAAQHGNFDAQCQLAIRLLQGVGVAPDSDQALKWWRWAAEHGCPQAQNDLGYALMTHVNSRSDVVEGFCWIQLAANSGIKKALINQTNFSPMLTGEQRQTATLRASIFRPKPVPPLNPLVRDGDPGTPRLDMTGVQ
jgi:localization factor PodJL